VYNMSRLRAATTPKRQPVEHEVEQEQGQGASQESDSDSPQEKLGSLEKYLDSEKAQAMRSNSRNFLLSASASRSEDDQRDEVGQNGQQQEPEHTGLPTSIHLQQHQQAAPGLPGQQQYIFPMAEQPVNANLMGMNGGHQSRMGLQQQPQLPTLADMYCHVQEMDTRLRHLELFVFANPNMMRIMQNGPVQPNVAVPHAVSQDEMAGFSVLGARQTSDTHEKLLHVIGSHGFSFLNIFTLVARRLGSGMLAGP